MNSNLFLNYESNLTDAEFGQIKSRNRLTTDFKNVYIQKHIFSSNSEQRWKFELYQVSIIK